VGSQHGMIRTPVFPVCASRSTVWLCSRNQVLTCLLTCQEALSQIKTRTLFPRAWTCLHSHKRQISGHLADRTAFHKAQMHATTLSLKHAITGERFWIRIVLVGASFLQTQWLVLLTPTVQIRLAHPAPPHFVLVADGPSVALG
jgi:hypothetical protein